MLTFRCNPGLASKMLDSLKEFVLSEEFKPVADRQIPLEDRIHSYRALASKLKLLKTKEIPLPPLELAAGLITSAKSIKQDLLRGYSGIKGSDNLTPSQRAAKHGVLMGEAKQTYFHTRVDPKKDIVGLLLSDA